MRKNRKEARDRLLAVKTVDELKACIDALNLTDEEREIAMMVYSKGWTRQKIAMETGYSGISCSAHPSPGLHLAESA